ncbi:MAG: RNA polymerase recycling motor ATPase HelR [Microbacterium sp.]
MTQVFDLPPHLAAKAAPRLIGGDQRHLNAVARTLARSIADLSTRRDAALAARGGTGQAAMDRDIEVHRLTARLSALRRFGSDVCLGHILSEGSDEPIYIGRLGLTDADGHQLLVDWRSPAAEPFFAATLANPLGLARRRRYRWSGSRITDYWDEAFTAEALSESGALDDQSAFIASLGSSRTARMRDVLGTIQADQDAVVRASSRGALVVDGGPGTGKTVVALHRSAYLLYSDPQLSRGRGGVLFVGPHQPYLDYVSDILPGLGEDGVATCTLRDLVPQGVAAAEESDPHVAGLKAAGRIVDVVERAVRYHEQPPAEATLIRTPWREVLLHPEEWADAFDVIEPGSAHNDARDEVLDELISILVGKLADEAPDATLRRSLRTNDDLRRALGGAWPELDAAGVVADLWSVPSYLRLCAPWLQPAEIAALQRIDPRAWTVSDLPLLDAARQRIGDPDASRRRQRNDAVLAAQRELRDRVRDDLIAADDSEMQVMSMLSREDFDNSLADEAETDLAEPDRLAGPFGHIVVDEAQELTDAEWRMLLLRCPSRSFTIVGDRAQARHGFTESWMERLERVGIERAEIASLTINFRTPLEVMAEAELIIRAALPDANVPTSVRSSGIPVRHAPRSDREAILAGWLEDHPEGIACVIGDADFVPRDRVRSLSPQLAKGLEFDLVVLVEPDTWGSGIEGAVDRYVAMTRATAQLVVLTAG